MSSAGLTTPASPASPSFGGQAAMSPSPRSSLGILGRSSSEAVDRELFNIKDDLQAVRDEAAASKEVITILRKQIEELQKEKETM
jgi:hypothetical protein